MDSPVRERRDDETWRVAQVLIGVRKLGIADVDEAMPLLFVPLVAQLGQPYEILRVLHLTMKQQRHWLNPALILKLQKVFYSHKKSYNCQQFGTFSYTLACENQFASASPCWANTLHYARTVIMED